MIKYIVTFIISFALGIFAREVIERLKKKKRYKKVKPLNKQNFKEAMKNLEIK